MSPVLNVSSGAPSVLSLDVSDIIGIIQSIVLLATLLFMFYDHRKNVSIMSSQLSELRDEIKINTHMDLYDKLLTCYYKYMEYPEDLKHIFRSTEGKMEGEVRREYMIFAILDILYLMYLQRDRLDSGLKNTWNLWSKKLFVEPSLRKIYEEVKNEYDPEYIKYIEATDRGMNKDEPLGG